MATDRLANLTFASIYPMYVQKVERKDHTVDELHTVIGWLTGYDDAGIAGCVADGRTFEQFFEKAPAMNPNAALIRGVICGYRVEDIEDPLHQKVRWLDKLVDELARGKKMASILRA
ncbi:DUF2200 domain-containing protein [Xylanimonas protaetiae]|uniref:DUF2200 domain-containing protein n=1 Tax=Xylanimonas protaetiae TaxID=2509457 RepID=A0A4P6F5J1_9MICO|nr:DUF2200 domain-containing protein [Xylanimonas protaetiae]QAY70884.1 DUF2200 domain-containing protein [Xylanimonas protaetiae]